MKVLVILFLAGFALAAANPLFELAQVGGFGNFVDDLDFNSDENKPTLDEVKEKLKEKLHDFLNKIKEALKGGNGIKDEILTKGKEIKEKFKLLKEQLDKEGNDFLEKLVDHGRDYLKAILDKLGVKNKRAIDYHVEAIMQAEDGDLIQKLKDKYKEVVKKVKDAIEQGKSLKEGLETLEKIKQKLKDFNIDLGDFGNEYLDQLKDKLRDYWQKLKDRLGVSKRNADIDVFGMVEDLKRLLKEKFNLDKIKAFVRKFFGEDNQLIEALKHALKEEGEKRFEKLRELIGKWFPQKESSSVKDVFGEIREFFRDLGIDIRNRFTKFGEWVKKQYEKGMEKSKSRLENIKKIAKDFLEDTRKISRDVAEEALQFFREYKKDLGLIFDDIEVKVKDILKQD